MNKTPALFYTSNKRYVLGTEQDALNNAIDSGFTQSKKSLKDAIKNLQHTTIVNIETKEETKIPDTINLYTDTLTNGNYRYTFTKIITIQ
jgi:hypothetical protein